MCTYPCKCSLFSIRTYSFRRLSYASCTWPFYCYYPQFNPDLIPITPHPVVIMKMARTEEVRTRVIIGGPAMG